ncbi:MAG TPA: lipopolysaccharide heptosyltransferase I [Gammaproteobacteria bacterium]|nr:lipopolysaccharide heptosyltransferase I [Gammaproteobacteria bacterium]
MGDIIHTLPALTDAGKAYPHIRFDWVVEENFHEIPGWHPLVERVIPVAVRRWRKKILSRKTHREIGQHYKTVRSVQYDLIIDAQGLFKTLWIAGLAKGPLCGLDRHSAREPLTALFYRKKVAASWKWHAVTRLRALFSQALGYDLPETVPDYGIDRRRFIDPAVSSENYLVFLHGTTWATKHWPEAYWIALADMAHQHGLRVKIPWGNAVERLRAERIAAKACADVLPQLSLKEMASVLAGAKAVVAVDTGLGHLSAALNVPTVSLYGPTDPLEVGTQGASQKHLSATFPCAPCRSRVCTWRGTEQRIVEPPCFGTVKPVDVWNVCRSIF